MKISKYNLLILAAIVMLWCQDLSAGKVSFEGVSQKVIEVKPEKNTGLDAIFVLYSAEEVAISYDSSQSEPSHWYRYSNLGGGYAEEIAGIEQSGSVSVLKEVQGDMGYIIETGDNRYYFWVVDYSKHRMTLDSIENSGRNDCGEAELIVFGYGDDIKYFTINGQQRVLSREASLIYNSLEWNEEAKMWQQIECRKVLDSFSDQLIIMPAPLCDTEFTLQGDKFLTTWREELSATSDVYRAYAVDARTEAVQQNVEEEKSNIISSGGSSGLGGSAPSDISFYAYVTDAVIHHEWQMAEDEGFENVIYRFNQQDLDYTFDEEGVYYLRYIGSNSDGGCEVYSDTYTVNIGTSELKCPNAFSPGVTEGVNDEWKVGYRSIIEFDCTIFNRWGVEMCHFTDPSMGWDGKYKGKLVKPGVYYYVIRAKGADGKIYKMSGDINIIRFNEHSGGSSSENEEM